jgi:hypothetical protein
MLVRRDLLGMTVCTGSCTTGQNDTCHCACRRVVMLTGNTVIYDRCRNC